MLMVAYTYGWRWSEVSGMTCQSFDVEQRVFRLNWGETKNKDKREDPITDANLLNALVACAETKKPNAPLFTREDGSAIRDLRDRWERSAFAAGAAWFVHRPCWIEATRTHRRAMEEGKKNVPKPNPADTRCKAEAVQGLLQPRLPQPASLRRADPARLSKGAAATNLIRRGVPMITATGLLGHRTTKLFSRYKLDDPAAKRDVLLMADAARQKELCRTAGGIEGRERPELSNFRTSFRGYSTGSIIL